MNDLMNALVLTEPGNVQMKKVPIPAYGTHELLIKTKAATICTSDIMDKNHNPFHIPLPVVMGHEGAGIVVAAGDAVKDIHVGDAVTAHPVMPCGKCGSCLRGLPHLCDDMEHLGLNRSGVFAEYFVSRNDRVRKIPPGMSFTHASLMEPVCVCLESLNRASVKESSRVLIIGDGPFGIMTARLCASLNPKQVILSGRHDYRLKKAVCTQIINEATTPDISGEIMRLTDGEGVDAAILCVSSHSAVDTAIAVLRSRGTLAIFSGISGKTPVDLFRVHVKELTIAGACNDMDFLDEAIKLLQDSTLNIGDVITHEIPFFRWKDAFYQAENGKDSGLKVSMIYSDFD